MNLTRETLRGIEKLQEYPSDLMPSMMVDIYNLHKDKETDYVFDEWAQPLYNMWRDETILDFRAQYTGGMSFY